MFTSLSLADRSEHALTSEYIGITGPDFRVSSRTLQGYFTSVMDWNIGR
jgi:hypothetical protein